MKDFADMLMLVLFVAFMIFLMRGFMLQVQDKDEKKEKE